MSGVSEAFQKVLGFFTDGGYEEESPFDDLVDVVGGKPVVDGNAVRKTDYATQPITKPSKQTNSNVAQFRGAKGTGTDLMVIEPRSFSEDSMQLIKYLQDGNTIVLNLHLLDKEQAQRLVDFVSGATQALYGHQQKIADRVFIFAPANISISADSMKSRNTMSDGIWGQRQY